jgi:tetratricopeptide (TPR) repeat protein
MFFGMASLYAYACYAQSLKLSRYFLCLILFASSLMGKSMLVTLPFVFLLLDYWPLDRWQISLNENSQGNIVVPLKYRFHVMTKLVLEKMPFLCLSFFSSIMTIWAQYEVNAFYRPFTERVVTAIVSYPSYLRKFFWPSDLAVYYPFAYGYSPWQILFSSLILTCITMIVIYAVKKLPFLFVGWFWYLGTLLPVSGLVQINAPMADRYTYMPLIGIVVGLAWGVPLLFQRRECRRIILFPVGLTIIIICMVLTHQQCRYWKNSESIFRHALNVTERNYLAHSSLGVTLFNQNRINEAFYHFNKAISIAPDIHGYYINRGNAYVNLGQTQRAINDYTKAISLKQNYIDAYYNRGTLYGKIGQHNLAIEDLNKTINLKTDHIQAFNNRGIVHNQMGSHKKSLDDFNEAIRLKPDYADAYNNRASLHFDMKHPELGCKDLRTACKLGNCTKLKAAEIEGLCR